MPDSRPEGADLVAVVRAWLEDAVLPGLEGEPRFQCRVAMSLLSMVERELQLKPAADGAERQRLQDLTGGAGDLSALNRRLCAQIESGAVAVDDPRLLRHLDAALRDALAINNPRWLPPAAPPHSE
ncbi:MAG: DUF6285 domain-containing protein [Sneathiellaceae bacterium]